MKNFDFVLNILKSVAMATASQLIGILGIFFVFGLILYFLAKFTRQSFAAANLLNLDTYFTGWIGTPVHELGHAFFCIVFGHKITEMRLFCPNSEDGSLGFVNHSYNPRSTYHKIGNFFIGAGPIIFGAFVLYALLHYLVPNKDEVFTVIQSKNISITELDINNIKQQFYILFLTGKQTVSILFKAENFKDYKFWIFLYVSLCVASHMQLSPPDISGMWSGFFALVFFLFIINGIGLIAGINISKYLFMVNQYTGLAIGLFIYAVIISAINFILTFGAMQVYSLVKFKRILNPFYY